MARRYILIFCKIEYYMKRNYSPCISLISALVTTLILCISPSHTLAANKMEVHFIDVGQGDSTLIILPNSKTILTDVGNALAGPKIVRYVKALGIDTIDHLILTHAHDDHIGSISSIASEFRINSFYDNGLNNFENPDYGDYIKLVRSDLSKYNIMQAGESIMSGTVMIEVLNPLLPPTGNLNEDSIAIRISYGDIHIFLAGDIGQFTEKRLLKTDLELKSRILKAGHHGDNNAGSQKFLEKVKPENVIISLAANNQYALPHESALARFKKEDANIYRTDLNGTIVIKTDGKTYTIHSEKGTPQ